jgi:hypothetical protein
VAVTDVALDVWQVVCSKPSPWCMSVCVLAIVLSVCLPG